MRVEDITEATLTATHLQDLKGHVIEGWLSNGADTKPDIQPSWTFRDELAMIDGVTMKG